MAGKPNALSWLVVFVLVCAASASASIFGNVRGVVHDPQHRPIKGAVVTIKSVSSDWQQTITTDNAGEFFLQAVPLGEYTVKVTSEGFALQAHRIIVNSGNMSDIHFQLSIAATGETVDVSDVASLVNPQSSRSETLIGRNDIAASPGADRSNSLQMITNFVPGSYMVHDQLHVRGGHQVSWLIDGVPVPNTNIGSNVGPQFDPKDMDVMEIQRGGYAADYGDRTYGVFNVIPRSGFERNREIEVLATYGSVD